MDASIVTNEWLPVPYMAFAARVLGKNILVWEPTGDGAIFRPYLSTSAVGGYNGLYVSDWKNDFIHVLYHGGRKPSGEYFVRFSTEQAPVGTVCTGNHFQTMVLDDHARGTFSAAAEQMFRIAGNPASDDRGEVVSLGVRPAYAPISTVDVASLSRCTATVRTGKRKGEICGKAEQMLGSGRCGSHVSQSDNPSKKPKMQMTGRARDALQAASYPCTSSDGSHVAEGLGEGGTVGSGAAFDSDDEFFQNQEDFGLVEDEPVSMNMKNIRRRTARISEPTYREAYLYVHEIHASKRRKKVMESWSVYFACKDAMASRVTGVFHHVVFFRRVPLFAEGPA